MKIQEAELSKGVIQFSEKFLERYQQEFNHLPLVEKDEEWPSECLSGEFDEKFSTWRPILVKDKLTFSNVEQALNLTLHDSVKNYYSVLYSDNIPATCDEGYLQLLFAWSKDDFNRLQQNIIGHVLMKQKLKQPVTIFFAVTDDNDIMLSVNNENGEVWAERVGRVPHRKIADSLTEFISTLTPDIYTGEAG